MRPTSLRIVPLLLASALLVLPSSARADEPAAGTSPAAKAFEEAFWQETGAGALDRALEGYRAALAADGPEAVRARAVYRSALVLQRLGRTEEAVKALESLAKGFPGEGDLLAEAKARLEEWSAVDLRTSFEEWYRRYRFTPQFQAKVLDLVLALGSPVDDQRKAAREELLTIGDAAIPALRAHLDSANSSLRGAAVSILLRLGDLPEPRHLLATGAYASDATALATIRKAEAGLRDAIARAASGDTAQQRLLRAVARGRDALLAELRQGTGGWTVGTLVQVLVDAAAEDPAALDGLEGVALDVSLPFEPVRRLSALSLARALPTERILAWVEKGDPELLAWLDQLIRDRGISGPTGWRVLLRALDRDPALPLVPGLLRLVEDATPPADEDAVIAVVLRSGHANFSGLPFGPRTAALLGRVARATEGEEQGYAAFHRWKDGFAHRAPTTEDLLAMAREARGVGVRAIAAQEAVRRMPVEGLTSLTSLLDPAQPMRTRLVAVALRDNARLLPALPTATLRRLRDLAGEPAADWLRDLLDALRRTREGDDLLTAHLVADPLSAPTAYFQGGHRPLGLSDARWAQTREAWPRYGAEARVSLVEGVLSALPLRDRPEVVEFLRERLLSSEEQAAVKEVVLFALFYAQVLRLADVTAVVDVTTEAGSRRLLPFLPALAADGAAYEATAWLRKSADAEARRAVYERFLSSGSPSLAAVAADAFADADPGIRGRALEVLAGLRAAEDVPLFRRGLSDADARVRAAAALALGSVWTGPAIDDLVRALDDPSPWVRDAALASLGRISRVETIKRDWLLYQQGRAPMPSAESPAPR